MEHIQSSTPKIIRETSRGLSTHDIVDEMLQDREIVCAGPITPQSANSLILQLRYLQKASPGETITMYLNTPGGEVQSGLAIYDTMRAIGCPIRTVCLGTAASMGALLFIAGDQRDMLPHSKVLIHDPRIPEGAGGTALELHAMSENLMRVREITAQVIAERTGRSLEEVYQATAHDSIFEAPEAVEYGLADRIIDQL